MSITHFEKLFTNLTHRELLVLSYRFGLDGFGSRTLEEIGAELGVTRERIRQIEAKALRKTRASASRNGIRFEEFLDS